MNDLDDDLGKIALRLFTADGKFRTQHYGVFNQEVDNSDLLFVKDVSSVNRRAAAHRLNTPEITAATNFFLSKMAVTFAPGFLIVLPNAFDTGVPQPPGRRILLHRDDSKGFSPEDLHIYFYVQASQRNHEQSRPRHLQMLVPGATPPVVPELHVCV